MVLLASKAQIRRRRLVTPARLTGMICRCRADCQFV